MGSKKKKRKERPSQQKSKRVSSLKYEIGLFKIDGQKQNIEFRQSQNDRRVRGAWQYPFPCLPR